MVAHTHTQVELTSGAVIFRYFGEGDSGWYWVFCRELGWDSRLLWPEEQAFTGQGDPLHSAVSVRGHAPLPWHGELQVDAACVHVERQPLEGAHGTDLHHQSKRPPTMASPFITHCIILLTAYREKCSHPHWSSRSLNNFNVIWLWLISQVSSSIFIRKHKALPCY